MAITINTNVSSLQAQKNLSDAQKKLQTSFDRLSSDYRISSAQDDAAGLAVSDSMAKEVAAADRHSSPSTPLTGSGRSTTTDTVTISDEARLLSKGSR